MTTQCFLYPFTGGCCINLHFCDFTAHFGRNRVRAKSCRYSWLSMSGKCRTSTHSGEEVVYGTFGHCDVGWHFTLWIHFHWDVSTFITTVVLLWRISEIHNAVHIYSFELFLFKNFQVFHFYIILGVQDLLRLRLHAFSIHYFSHCHGLCNHCMHILPP